MKVNGDTTVEQNETFDVDLSTNSSNSTIADGTGVGTIQNDDDPAISIGNDSDTEGNTGEKDFTFNVTLNAPSSETVTVDYATADNDATTADGDYDSNSSRHR